MWDLVREVAEGRIALMNSPADMLRKFPDADPEFIERVWRNINRLVENDRENAGRIFRAFERLVNNIGR